MVLPAWVRRTAYWIGRQFCEVDDRELARRIDVLTRHTEECDQKHERLEGELQDLLRRFDAIKADRDDLFRQLTEDEGDPWLRLEQSG